MFMRAAVIAVTMALCFGLSVDDALALDDTSSYLNLMLSIRDPYRDTTGVDPSVLTEPVSDPCLGGLPMTFSLFKEETGGDPIWREELPCVPVAEDGYVDVLLGRISALHPAEVMSHDVLYLEVTIEDETLSPRILIVFSDHVLVMDVVSEPTEPVESGSDSSGGAPLVYSAGQRSLGAIAIGSDPEQPRFVIFGDAVLSRSGRLPDTLTQRQVALRLSEQERTIGSLRSELKRLAGELAKAKR